MSKHPGQQVWWLRQYCNPGRTAGVKILFGTVLCNPALRPADSSTLQVCCIDRCTQMAQVVCTGKRAVTAGRALPFCEERRGALQGRAVPANGRRNLR